MRGPSAPRCARLWRWFVWLWLALGAMPATHATPVPEAGAETLQKVRVQLKWTHQFQFAGFYAAIAQGYFRKAGLNVELLEGGPLINPTDMVLEGKAEFGIGNSSLLIDFNRGRPVVAVAAILQHSPAVILARLDPSLRSVRDLEGKTLMAESHMEELTAYLTMAGVDIHRVRRIAHNGNIFSMGATNAKQVDALTAYATTEPFEATRRNIPYQIFSPRDLGINFYGDTLFTSQQFAQQHPKVVAALRDALLEGWRYALSHQAEIVDLLIRSYHPQMDKVALNFEAQATYNLFQTDLVDIGYMSRERWHSIGEVYAASGMLEPHFSLDGFLFAPEKELPPWAYRTLLFGSLAIVLGGLLAAYIASLNMRLSTSLKKLEEVNLELARLSTTDALTGLFNRRYFDERLANEWSRAARHHSPLSLLMVDIDFFKRYNDTLGHPAGDACLQQVAQVLRNNAQRAGEFASRIGGEEFAVVACPLNQPQIAQLAERILQDIAALHIPHPGSPFGHVTVSIGCCTLDGSAEQTPVQLIARADAALYRAKEEGRNRYVAAACPPNEEPHDPTTSPLPR